ncbi:hypothetical protein [Psychrobacter maritimus]|uniref:hypothetical protein n=1 Tax=Psychrobacter maritimus TaxID=256325 RepID=UPI003F66D0D1
MRASDLKTLPSSIGNLNKLKGLGLYHNGLQTLPDSITNLKKLEQVDVQGNALSDLSEAVCQFLDGVGGKPT